MKKALLIFFTLLAPVFANALICVPDFIPSYAPEIRISYFRANSEQFQKIYSDALGAYDFDLNIKLKCGFWGWTGIGILGKQGIDHDVIIDYKVDKDKNLKPIYQRSNISLVPVSCGLKYYLNICPYIDGYVGGCARWNFARIKNHKHRSDYSTAAKSTGFAMISGLRMFLDGGIYFTPFVEYSKNNIVFKNRRRVPTSQRINDVGGLRIGGGLGVII